MSKQGINWKDFTLKGKVLFAIFFLFLVIPYYPVMVCANILFYIGKLLIAFSYIVNLDIHSAKDELLDIKEKGLFPRWTN